LDLCFFVNTTFVGATRLPPANDSPLAHELAPAPKNATPSGAPTASILGKASAEDQPGALDAPSWSIVPALVEPPPLVLLRVLLFAAPPEATSADTCIFFICSI
jgi:hypothetical protein